MRVILIVLMFVLAACDQSSTPPAQPPITPTAPPEAKDDTGLILTCDGGQPNSDIPAKPVDCCSAIKRAIAKADADVMNTGELKAIEKDVCK